MFLEFGSYKQELFTAGGTELSSIDDIPNPAPFDETFTLDETAILNTGDIWCALKNGTRTGAVRLNGRTIGSAASSATERANADCAALYAYIWDNTADAQCPVATGRGASAAADFAANKAITLPSWRGAAPTGFDDMGNTAAGLYASAPVITGSGILAGSLLGANTHAILEAQVPSHTHSFSATTSSDNAHSHTFSGTSSSDGVHTHTGTTGNYNVDHSHAITNGTNIVQHGAGTLYGGGASGTVVNLSTAGQSVQHQHAFTTDPNGAHTHTYSGTTSTQVAHTHTVSGTTGTGSGSGTAHNIMQRSAPVTWFIKL